MIVFLVSQSIIVGVIQMLSTNWYEYIFFKEKLKYLFDNELSPDNLYIDSFNIYERVAVINFITMNIPQKYPKKWKSESFNAIIFRLTFSDLTNFSIQGNDFFNKIGRLDTKIIDNKKTLIFTSENLYIELSALNIMFGDFKPLKR